MAAPLDKRGGKSGLQRIARSVTQSPLPLMSFNSFSGSGRKVPQKINYPRRFMKQNEVAEAKVKRQCKRLP